MLAEPASDPALNLRSDPISDASSVPGVCVASDPLSGMMKGKPEARTWAYSSEQPSLPMEGGDTVADRRSGMVPDECTLRACLVDRRRWPDGISENEAEAARLGGCGRLVGPSLL